jgi:hypothetical protein
MLPVFTKNLVRIDLEEESLIVGRDGRADISLLEPGCRSLKAENAALRR